ncbi:hypothetical protein NE237_023357 [Protea cynaroides]|uniref:Uncharacterized protein n=1 Tax=Protea cynaroides TaxID=273540 RepID=A0A9Q0HC16_9MAGN|nr:hypothetical protein NE237_023357 [Protea cynaroides]
MEWLIDDNPAPRIRTVLDVLVPILRVPQIRVILLHEPNHAVITKTDHLKLILSKIVCVDIFRVFKTVEEVLGNSLAFLASVLLGFSPELCASFDSACRGTSSSKFSSESCFSRECRVCSIILLKGIQERDWLMQNHGGTQLIAAISVHLVLSWGLFLRPPLALQTLQET